MDVDNVNVFSPVPKIRYCCRIDKLHEPLVPRWFKPWRDVTGTAKWVINPRVCLTKPNGPTYVQFPFAEALRADEPQAWVADPVSAVVAPFALGPALTASVEAIRGDASAVEHLLPSLIPHLRDSGLIFDEYANAMACRTWQDLLGSAAHTFRMGYVSVGSLLHPFTLAALRVYFRDFVARGFATRRRYPPRLAAHNDPVARFMHHQLTP